MEIESVQIAGLSVEQVAQFLSESGYRAVVTSERLVRSATNGVKFLVSVQPNGWLQFAMSLRTAGGITLTAVNEFNRKYRFCRAYLDPEDDVVLEADFYLTGNLQPVFSEYMSLWGDMIAAMLMFSRERRTAEALEDASGAL